MQFLRFLLLLPVAIWRAFCRPFIEAWQRAAAPKVMQLSPRRGRHIRVRHASLYCNGKKAREVFETKYKLDGYDGSTCHAIVESRSVVPFEPDEQSLDFAALLVHGTTVDLALGLVAGKIHQLPGMTVESVDYESDARTGSLIAVVRFGGRPKVVVGAATSTAAEAAHPQAQSIPQFGDEGLLGFSAT